MTLQEDTVVAPRCQQMVKAQTVYRTLEPSTSQWVTKTFDVAPGLRLARTMVADRPSDVAMQIQIMNTNDQQVRVLKGHSLGNMEEVVSVAAEEECVESSIDYSHVASLIQNTDESLSAEQQDDFRQFLVKYSNVFSKGDHDLGCATAVKHHIDTGDSQPVRQSLRRQPPHYVSEIDRQLTEWENE